MKERKKKTKRGDGKLRCIDSSLFYALAKL
jgi:hypothetical protein